MTDLDLDALEAVARAATPGPWEWEPPVEETWTLGQESLVTVDHGEDGYPEEVLSGWGHDASGTDASDEDRAHIAAFDPPTTLALIARVKEAERKQAEAESERDSIIAAVEAIEPMWPRGMYGCPQDMFGRAQIRAVLSRHKPSTENGSEHA
ncbi:hypothetical protein PTQ19_10250 [Microbacterium esteraromaticum]|uniref:hypothetical protein n=1 Tax=Microbacterium esteraromaticum TaxID=57043 RepID=UPI002368EC22|nr:hypothetical protein [Microbacterium esteraromaticum]WDH77902.1 hypothetical protein PTQ19_10250 [Microbacterium esteraromaticum]